MTATRDQRLSPEEITALLKQELARVEPETSLRDTGVVLQVGDGVARIYGLTDVRVGELIRFQSGTYGIALNLEEDVVGAVIMGETRTVREHDRVERTGRIASILVGDQMIGRVVNTLGEPVDGKGPIGGELIPMPLERKAPGVIYREPVREPLQTGILAIDAMIPIGRGQRELIIGDRQTGKTTIAIDAIINQRREYERGKPVICIYVACGQKASSIAQTIRILEEYGAMDYTIVVAAPASYPAPLIYLAPYAGCAIGEYFRDTGRHALIVYDDLSKQAVAYREVALLLRRPPGREAYPGDIFYLHSRLLERAAKIISNDEVAAQMNDLPESLKGKVKGGGSLTALPIIETQAGDVSAYIPTNVISITDGQIYLKMDLFNAGIRPAIDVGISVSRVGGNAQIKAMKQLAGRLKLEMAQYWELEAFAKFGSELDPASQAIIEKGRRLTELLKQEAHQTYSVGEQLALIYVGTQGLIMDLPVSQIKSFAEQFLKQLSARAPEVLQRLDAGEITDEIKKRLEQIAEEVKVAMQEGVSSMEVEPA